MLALFQLSGKKKFLAFIASIGSVLVNHFVFGNPDPRIDQLLVTLGVAYQAFESLVDAARAFVAAKSEPKQLEGAVE